MKFTLSWLKDHLDTNKDLDSIVDTLTNIGLEIESVEDKSKDFSMLSNDEQVKQEKQVLQQKQAEADQLIQQLETMKEQGIDKTSVPPEFGGTKDDVTDEDILNR